MVLLWTIPALAAVAGAVLLIVMMASIEASSGELRAQLERLSAVRAAVADARAEAERLRR